MLKSARLLDSAAGSHTIGEDAAAGYGCKSDNKSSTEAKQQCGVKHTRQKWKEVKQAEYEEGA
jgi:hypothetical protein